MTGGARSVVWSLAAHCSVFVAFSFSLGVFAPVRYPAISYLGALPVFRGRQPAAVRQQGPLPSRAVEFTPVPAAYLKPPAASALVPEKRPTYAIPVVRMPLRRVDTSVMLYPQLPAAFLLYFSDRQQVHIELSFLVHPGGEAAPTVIVKRRISSGNLEADLLSMRAISRYLFIQQGRFVPGEWHTVKIDLSPKKSEPDIP